MLRLFTNLTKKYSINVLIPSSKIMMISSVSSDMIFAQKFNPVSGTAEWEPQDENFDYHQEIARSAYADMLHDTERNQMYEAGLRWAIFKLRAEGKPVRVLDIGTGTGLLAMFACRLGADKVTACEAFAPVANCARRIIKENHFEDKINLIPKRSTDLKVGPGCDMEERATILVTEVFDTELIGEGAIHTYNHAHEHLLEKGCLVVPSRARVFCQIVESTHLRDCHQHKPVKIPGCEDVVPPSETDSCQGSAAVLDIQLSQLPRDTFKLITAPFQVCSFDFTGESGNLPKDDKCLIKVAAKSAGKCDALLFWWDIDMDKEGELVLSCAPWWNHPKGKELPWRDHWMQAVYFPVRSVEVKENQNLSVECCHDEYSFWFDVKHSGEEVVDLKEFKRRPVCTCGLHLVCNPQRISVLNDSQITNQQIEILKKMIAPEKIFAFIGSGCSMMPLLAARLGAKKVYVYDTSRLSEQILSSYIKANGLQSRITILSKSSEDITSEDFDGNKIDVVLSEPYFLRSYLPWHDISLWYSVIKLKMHLQPNYQLLPGRCQFWAVGMSFKHLWKIRAPLGNVEGFDMRTFDELVQNSTSVADSLIEPHPLWEYEGVALTQPIQLLELDLYSSIDDGSMNVKATGSAPFKRDRICNGVAVWGEWFFNEETKVTQGPKKPIVCGEEVIWNFNSKQGVYFVDPMEVTVGNVLNYNIRFDPKAVVFTLQFNVR